MDCIKQRDEGVKGGRGEGGRGGRRGWAFGAVAGWWAACNGWPTGRKAALSSPLLSCEFFVESNLPPPQFDLRITLIFLEEEEERAGWLDFGENKGMDRWIGMNSAGFHV